MRTDLIQHAFHGQAVRAIIDERGEPLFVLADLCAALGIGNSRMVAQRLHPDGVSLADVIDSMGRTQRATVVTESGMYEVVLRSDSPRAVPFRQWVTTEVLPSIRRTGSYGTATVPDISTPQGVLFLAQQFTATAQALVESESKRLALEGPAAERDLYRSAAGLQLVGDVANRFIAYAKDRFPDVSVTHKQVWNHAHRLGLLIRGDTVRHNQPTAEAIRAGWVKPSEHVHETNTRGPQRTVTTRLTPKGEARLWDGLVSYVIENGSLEIGRAVA
jgi:prophage antirepressor-like protein